MERAWFTQDVFTRVIISDYKEATDCSFGIEGRIDNVARRVEITNQDIINNLVGNIRALPVDGDMMVSFGDDIEYLTLDFYGLNGIDVVEFYGASIKTPGTSFYAEEKDIAEEKRIFKYIETLFE